MRICSYSSKNDKKNSAFIFFQEYDMTYVIYLQINVTLTLLRIYTSSFNNTKFYDIMNYKLSFKNYFE